MSSDRAALPGIEFRTVPMTNRQADALHSDLGASDDVANVYLAGEDGEAWSGAVLPSDPSDLARLGVAERLRDDPRIVSTSVVPGHFPEHGS